MSRNHRSREVDEERHKDVRDKVDHEQFVELLADERLPTLWRSVLDVVAFEVRVLVFRGDQIVEAWDQNGERAKTESDSAEKVHLNDEQWRILLELDEIVEQDRHQQVEDDDADVGQELVEENFKLLVDVESIGRHDFLFPRAYLLYLAHEHVEVSIPRDGVEVRLEIAQRQIEQDVNDDSAYHEDHAHEQVDGEADEIELEHDVACAVVALELVALEVHQGLNLVEQRLVLDLRTFLVVNAEIPAAEDEVAVLIKLTFTLHQPVLKFVCDRFDNCHKRVKIADDGDDDIRQREIVVNIEIVEEVAEGRHVSWIVAEAEQFTHYRWRRVGLVIDNQIVNFAVRIVSWRGCGASEMFQRLVTVDLVCEASVKPESALHEASALHNVKNREIPLIVSRLVDEIFSTTLSRRVRIFPIGFIDATGLGVVYVNHPPEFLWRSV